MTGVQHRGENGAVADNIPCVLPPESAFGQEEGDRDQTVGIEVVDIPVEHLGNNHAVQAIDDPTENGREPARPQLLHE